MRPFPEWEGPATRECASGLGLLLALTACATVPSPERSLAATKHADELRAKEKMSDAATAYGEALDLDPTNLAALRGYVELSHLNGQTGAVIAKFRGEISSNPADPYAHEGLGLALFTAGGSSAEHAQAELARSAELAPTIADFQYRLGLYLVESDKFDDAIKPLAKAVELDKRKARYRLPYALALARSGKREAAVAELQAVLALSPTHEEVTKAEKTARALVDPFRGFPQAAREQWEVALGYLDHDATNQARQVLDALMQKYPDIAVVHALAGLTAAKADDASRSIYELRRAIELDPSLAEPRLWLGDIYNSRGRPDNAREHYEAAIARNPFLADAYKRLAEVHLAAGEAEAAANFYGTFLLLRPDDLPSLIARAKVLSDLHNPEAAAAWDAAQEVYPTRVEVLVPRAKYYFEVAARATNAKDRKAAKEESRKSLDKAITVDPENATASAVLSELEKLPDLP